jgi:hypothetical protein
MLVGAGFVLVLGLASVRTDYRPNSSRAYPSRALIPDAEAALLPSTPLSDEWFPCSDCHGDEPTNREPRTLEDDHEDHKLAHGELWCLNCHDADQRDMLHLSDDTLIEFQESWRLCTQCHGKKLADWRAGVHGKRTGHWRGPKDYQTCVVCHDPHEPLFEALEPDPPPWRPEMVRLNGPDRDRGLP